MSHARNKIWVHGVFATKYRKSLISKKIQPEVYKIIHIHLKKMGCYLKAIGGVEDHVHILFLMSRTKSVAEVFKQIKGASSHDINQLNLTNAPFYWQGGYAAFSVSESKVNQVIRYIERQEEHHKKMPTELEWRILLEKHGLMDDSFSQG